MLFNSLTYALFLPLVFFVYWFLLNRNLKAQNFFLLIVSYIFYGWWDWRFVFLLAFSTALDYFSGIFIHESKTHRRKKIWLIISVGINLGFLGFFKYYNFFIDSFADLLRTLGFQPHFETLNIILPVGISFYTFHGLSYVIDIYYGKIKPTYNWVNYTLFVCFFPLLVAGPIERATHLLPQVERPRTFKYSQAMLGIKQIVWGLFKKIVVADNCAIIANEIFNNSADQSSGNLIMGAIFFSFQIYGDFSGYSDIALGSARLLGIELLKNFNFPYLSRSIAEFWRRWHISLNTWFRDYLYIPLGGSQGGNWMRIRNTFAIFLVSGFWHGANWTFIIWGGLNALYMMPSMLFKTNRKNLNVVAENSIFPNVKEIIQMFTTFLLAAFAWIFFRAESVGHAISYIKGIFINNRFEITQTDPLILIVLLMTIEWFSRKNEVPLEKSQPLYIASFYFILCILILFLKPSGQNIEFIYFQF